MKITRQNDTNFHEEQLQCLELGHHYIKNDMLAGMQYGALISLRFSIRQSLRRCVQMRRRVFMPEAASWASAARAFCLYTNCLIQVADSCPCWRRFL